MKSLPVHRLLFVVLSFIQHYVFRSVAKDLLLVWYYLSPYSLLIHQSSYMIPQSYNISQYMKHQYRARIPNLIYEIVANHQLKDDKLRKIGTFCIEYNGNTHHNNPTTHPKHTFNH